MNNIDKICDYLNSGKKEEKRIGLELEHFVCDGDYHVISYEDIAECMQNICALTSGQEYYEDGELFGLVYDDYSISLEPGCQIEISISPQDEISKAGEIYKGFRQVWDKALAARGYRLYQSGVHPLVENGTLLPDCLPLIPKKRYAMMDRYFENTGKYGKHMMRATTSTQVSIDFESMEDAIVKLRVFEKLSPILALMTENHGGLGTKKEWDQHILRTQIWNDLDSTRCGYFPCSLQKDYTVQKYAEYLYQQPCILSKEGNQIVDGKGVLAADFYGDREIPNVEYFLSLYFPTIRLKQYVEIRVADSMPINQTLGYATLIQKLAYHKESLMNLDSLLGAIEDTDEIYRADCEVAKLGYTSVIYGRPVMEWMDLLFTMAADHASLEEVARMQNVMPLPLIQYRYVKMVSGQEKSHVESAMKEKEYILNSTAK